ncbi:hypothetical protein LB557_21625 [Mesorhizobium sp. BR115XR7A]|uniref:hypothetical protein n=1 Tax=Mesorhizobium sp. BR115XR7A TaxID=2876645 RepID=UPI001CCDFFD9|nr:hypothetical protein [Mesorhizobium sp. BR115XR7A]MBZ9908615.1 hypothetical protein [Mesorhizobium sp. BR115XR7A]MBZ9933241.1 hypothetical protein [Mesorhizobium sp. BR1-1-5]
MNLTFMAICPVTVICDPAAPPMLRSLALTFVVTLVTRTCRRRIEHHGATGGSDLVERTQRGLLLCGDILFVLDRKGHGQAGLDLGQPIVARVPEAAVLIDILRKAGAAVPKSSAMTIIAFKYIA